MQSEENRKKAMECVDYLLNCGYIHESVAFNIKYKIEEEENFIKKLKLGEVSYGSLIRNHILEDKTENILGIINGN